MPEQFENRLIPEKVIPAHTERISVGSSCDLCGRKTRNKPDYDHAVNWAEDYDINTTCISSAKGYHSPEGGTVSFEFFVICNECFDSKLKPWIASQGAIPSTDERDY